MGNVVIFRGLIKCEEDFSRFGNFIYKVLEYKEINCMECKNITSIQCTGGMQPRVYCEYVMLNEDGLREIKKPENIAILKDGISPIFILEVDKKDFPEIVQYKELMLLVQFFRQAEVYCILHGDEKFYYTISQYYSLCNQDKKIYNKIFFCSTEEIIPNRLKRLATAGEDGSSSFFPLMYVNDENNRKMKMPCMELLGEEVLNNLFENQYDTSKRKRAKINEKSSNIKWEALRGTIKLWRDNLPAIKGINKNQIVESIKDMDTLSFILLSYTLKNFAVSKRNIALNEFKNYIEVLRQYANACYQLLENIVFHSAGKWGILSIRVHTSEDEQIRKYLIEKYNLYSGDSKPYFEIEISDFNGRQNGLNIAQNFYLHVPDKDKVYFNNIKPINLFRSSVEGMDEMQVAWEAFYRKPENLGKHFGLRIFQRIISENRGKFIAESHQNYIGDEGDNYFYGCEKNNILNTFCMPGTSYHIVLPLESLQEHIVEKDITQEYGDWLRENGEWIIAYTGRKVSKGTIADYTTQEEKNDLIKTVAEKYIETYETGEETVLFYNMMGDSIEKAEVWAKAVILALNSMKNKNHIVLYNCSEEFINQIWTVLVELFRNTGIEEAFHNTRVQIMLISAKMEQTVFIPASMEDTDNVNQYISRVKGVQCNKYTYERKNYYEIERGREQYIPFDVIEIDDGICFFELYVQNVLCEDIQSEKLGCQIKNTHMRLGSTIHIDRFYEAEILFGNKYFITRFAFLILKDCYKELKDEKKVSLYGYAGYSEALLVELCCAVRKLLPEIDIDYIILEREEEKRGFSYNGKEEADRRRIDEQNLFSHVDRIRYNRQFTDTEQREKYLKDRKFILIVPINSTLKTHQRLISFLVEENQILSKRQDWILKNYAIILVGSEEDNDYWKKDPKNKNTLICNISLEPRPKYFIEVKTHYRESLVCDMCYPDNPIDELPLIEVNAASTIPNQAFGLYEEVEFSIKEKEIKEIVENEKQNLECLKECLMYGHTVRNENHFLYYFSTELLAQNQKEEIEKTLNEWKQNCSLADNVYNVIISPVHFTNSIFIEYVNEKVFSGMATIIRIDFNKDFRSNVYVKYSNLRQYLKQLNDAAKNSKVNFHFVDDSIITGKTYWRAKSLIESLVESYSEEYPNVEITIFDKIFILLDRNSSATKMQYVSKRNKNIKRIGCEYYTFKQLEISSIRTYGDSCILCNLKKEADLLYNTASTRIVKKYWERSNEKFSLVSVEDALMIKNNRLVRRDEIRRNRAFRRLLCTHTVKKSLDVLKHGNQTSNILLILLVLIRVDYQERVKHSEENAFEVFLSYLKVISRPFLVFQKAVKEAVFDLLLLIMENVLQQKSILQIVNKSNKSYLKNYQIRKELGKFEEAILKKLTFKQKEDLVLLLMKQLCELKSNYVLRAESMNKLIDFIYEITSDMNEEECGETIEDFFAQYIVLIKRLTGVSSDTSKSLWLDRKILENYSTYHNINKEPVKQFLELIILENTRNFRDGIDKIYQKVKNNKFLKEKLIIFERAMETKEYYRDVYSKMLIREKEIWEGEKEELKSYLENNIALEYLLNGNIKKITKNIYERDISETWEKIISQVMRMNSNSNYQKKIENISSKHNELCNHYSGEISGYQYQNFIKLLELMGLYNKVITQEGYRQITACLAVKHICDEFVNNENDSKIWKKIQLLTRFLGEILGGIPVQLVMEVEGSSEFYKQAICEKINWVNEGRNSKIAIRKHYEIIKQVDEVSGSLLEIEIDETMNREDILMQLNQYGYALQDKAFIWKIDESGEFPIYLFASYWKKIDNDAKLRIRNILMLSKELGKKVFGRKQLEYLKEAVNANRNLKIYHHQKTFSHTTDEVQKRQFAIIQDSFNITEDDIDKDSYNSYRSSNLRFLADMNVSNIFRRSLEKEFYQSSLTLSKMDWNDDKNLLNGDRKIVIRQGNNKPFLDIIIKNEKLFEGDEQILPENKLWVYENAENEMILLLVSLILNVVDKAQGDYRGVVENDSINVILSKTRNGGLRISNKTTLDKEAVDRAKDCLQREPGAQERGISLWSMQAYIRRIISAFVFQLYEKEQHFRVESEIACRQLEILMGDNFGINVGIDKVNGDSYFWYEIPVFCEKYEEMES